MLICTAVTTVGFIVQYSKLFDSVHKHYRGLYGTVLGKR